MKQLNNLIITTLGMIEYQLQLIADSQKGQTNIADQLVTATELAGILQTLSKIQAQQLLQEGSDGEKETQGQSKKQTKAQELENIFNDTNNTSA